MITNIRKYATVLSIIALCMAFAAGGWVVRGWKESARYSALETKHAQGAAAQAQKDMSDIVAAANIIRNNANAGEYRFSILGGKIAELKKGLSDATVLPSDCRPDAVRMRGIAEAVHAANAAATGQQPVKAVPNAHTTD